MSALERGYTIHRKGLASSLVALLVVVPVEVRPPPRVGKFASILRGVLRLVSMEKVSLVGHNKAEVLEMNWTESYAASDLAWQA